MTASFSQWLLEPYGAPTSTSEVNRIPNFYRAEALTVFGPSLTVMATEAPETASGAAEIPMEILPDIAATAESGSSRPAV